MGTFNPTLPSLVISSLLDSRFFVGSKLKNSKSNSDILVVIEELNLWQRTNKEGEFYFSDIPPKVTLNEYLEIAKEYSTPKSNLFINGVLDSLVKEYEKTNRMNKQGRGLL